MYSYKDEIDTVVAGKSESYSYGYCYWYGTALAGVKTIRSSLTYDATTT